MRVERWKMKTWKTKEKEKEKKWKKKNQNETERLQNREFNREREESKGHKMQYIPLPKNGLDRLTRDDTVESLLEPGNSPIISISHDSCFQSNPARLEEEAEDLDLLLRPDPVRSTDLADSVLPGSNSHTRSAHDDVEVHTKDTNSGVVLDTKVNVLLDTETEVTGLGEVPRGRVSAKLSSGVNRERKWEG